MALMCPPSSWYMLAFSWTKNAFEGPPDSRQCRLFFSSAPAARGHSCTAWNDWMAVVRAVGKTSEMLTVVLHGKCRHEDHHHQLFSIDYTVSLTVMAFESCSQPSGREWKTKRCITFKMLSKVWEQHTRVFFFISKALRWFWKRSFTFFLHHTS